MANQQHLEILKSGVDVWNQWRRENPEIIPDLEAASLRGECLDMIDLSNANMERIDLYRATLCGADLCDANLHMAHLYRTDFSDANLSNSTLRGADLVRAKLIRTLLCGADLRWVKLGETDLSGADLTSCAVYGVCAWDIKLDKVKQSNLDITNDKTRKIVVEDLETAQIIHILRDYKKMLNFINVVKKRDVLLLGRFSDNGRDLLHLIAKNLRNYGYLPMIFDFDLPDNSDFTETVKLLAAISRFVIVELSGPSVPQELYATVPHFKIPFVPIVREKQNIYFTFRDFLHYDWVLDTFVFKDEEALINAMKAEIIDPAEKKIEERSQKYGERIKTFELKNAPEKDVPILMEEEDLRMYTFRLFRKTALLKARVLTEEDYQDRKGTIKTLEGFAAFVPGDYLMRGIDNEEWPMTKDHFQATYEKISVYDKEGFASYRTNDIRQAYQVLEAFDVKRTNGDVLNGKAGDYLVKSGEKLWITDQAIFERSYEAVS